MSRSPLTRYAFAVVATALAVLLRLALNPVLGEGNVAYITLFVTLAIVGAVAGLRPALLSLVLGALAAWYLIHSPPLSFEFMSAEERASLVAYVIAGTLCALIGDMVRRGRIRAEANAHILEEREHRIAGLLGSIGDAFLCFDSQWRYTYGNDKLLERVGRKREEVIGHNVWDLFPQAVGLSSYVQLHRAMSERVPVEYEIWYEPMRRWFFDRAYPTADGGLAVYSVDITERKRMEDAIARQLSLTQSLTDNTAVVLTRCSRDFRYLFVNQACAEYLRLPREQIEGALIEAVMGVNAFRTIRPYCERVLRGETVEYEAEIPYERCGTRFMQVRYVPDCDPSGQVQGWFASVQDVTQRKQAEQALRDSEQRIRQIIQQLPAGVGVMDPSGKWVLTNPLMDQYVPTVIPSTLPERVPRWRAWDEQGNPIPPENWPGQRALRGEVVAPGLEMLHRTDDGQDVWMRVSAAPLRDENGQIIGATCVVQNINVIKRAEQAVRDSEARFRSLVSILTDVPWVTDAAGAFIEPQPAWEAYTGQTWDQHKGFGWADALHPDDGERVKAIWLKACESKTTYESRGRLWHAPTQQYRHYVARATPLLNADGFVREWVGTCTDVNEQRRVEEALRESEALFRTMGEAVPDFLWMADPEGRPIYQNPAWRQYVGMTHEELAARGWGAVHHPDDVPALQRVWAEAVAQGKAFQVEARTRRHDGAYRWFAGRTVPLKDAAGRVVKWVGTMTDIHDRKQAEESLQEADRRKDEFLATLAHELRNPLAPIRNSLHVLRLAGADAAAQGRVVDMMERQVNHMVRLVDDLLEVSRITRGKIELRKETVELAAVVRSAVEAVGPAVEAAGHQLAISLPPEPVLLEADPVRLAQVLVNLLNNAAKYTEAGGQVWLTARREGDQVTLSVRDTGTGIPAEMLPRVFDLFTQVDRTLGRAQGGLGIGLALVKSLVQLHGGSVQARSEGPGRGSEFVVRLPLAGAGVHDGRPGKAGPDKPSAALSGHRILVVDDNRDAADSLGMLLRFLGAEVRTAYDGPSALEAIRVYRPAVVLLDLGMPGMDGYAVAAQVRREPQFQEVTLIALTGWGQEEDKRRTEAAGFSAHLVKPPDANALQTLLASLPQGRSRLVQAEQGP